MEMPASIGGVADVTQDEPSFDSVLGGITEQEIVDLLEDSPDSAGKRTTKCRMEMGQMCDMFGVLPQCPVSDLPLHVNNTQQIISSRPNRTSSVWKEYVERARNLELERKAGGVNVASSSVTLLASPLERAYRLQAVPIVRVLTQTELNELTSRGLDTSRGPQDKQIVLLYMVIETFTLNEDQIRAFYIAAYYLHHHEPDALYMHLGGVGGTGKSRVLLALMFFLIVRREEHRFVVWGPTGTSAALVDGSTYHSQLGFGHKGGDSDRMPGTTALSKVRGRLDRVDLVFLDEVSMVCCADLYRISAQMTKAFDDPLIPFGGKSFILAGDIAQLPPPGQGAHALYSDTIASWSSGQSAKHQANSIGKALWHMFTCVIILRQNMRQTGMSSEDIAFRTALDNLRLKACTDTDIALFRTRCVYPTLGDTVLTDARFRDISIITARNHHRDGINECKARRFAVEHHKQLQHFTR
ncbi:ATP-dependent DNA helicase PIF1 [Grifola frondosa]|uniref:ATP-dependent DNA helicase n=1 Tax=Grifola frondosa TaxID=5627 RepID=A0A1C7MJE3_GRIFR|nr:ATP-dependent DNA helicase PIF1 [Grifola frondosa]